MTNPVHRVTFHGVNFTDEKVFATAAGAEQFIKSVMRGEIVYSSEEDGDKIFVPLHRINGAILHPQPAGEF